MEYSGETKYTKDHLWVTIQGGIATVGITPYAAEQLGDILFVDLPEVGDEISSGDVFSEVESAKTNSELILPFNGEVVEANDELDDSPELINEDAYEAWIAKFKVDEDVLEGLLSALQYNELTAEEE